MKEEEGKNGSYSERSEESRLVNKAILFDWILRVAQDDGEKRMTERKEGVATSSEKGRKKGKKRTKEEGENGRRDGLKWKEPQTVVCDSS